MLPNGSSRRRWNGAIRISGELTAARDHTELGRLSGELADAQRAVDLAEEGWLALATEAESIGLEV